MEATQSLESTQSKCRFSPSKLRSSREAPLSVLLTSAVAFIHIGQLAFSSQARLLASVHVSLTQSGHTKPCRSGGGAPLQPRIDVQLLLFLVGLLNSNLTKWCLVSQLLTFNGRAEQTSSRTNKPSALTSFKVFYGFYGPQTKNHFGYIPIPTVASSGDNAHSDTCGEICTIPLTTATLCVKKSAPLMAPPLQGGSLWLSLFLCGVSNGRWSRTNTFSSRSLANRGEHSTIPYS